ncbi:hypothetical protein GCM10022243_48570 [Saccharothrix violaceirubra]|uniref:DUF397 domain-containing protein n=1 Tax=Saccharothrix violaceirubra TaxID=413306 RepID=A0A7W7WU35_9PSEU|nr:DUF397 domain-containing protein [Saccharothrix violaceirubra]MBB4963799.1 hypothetical protein [Saccharothrix violaceirubra]
MSKDEAPDWRVSSWSASESNCVEIHRDLGAVRDSKNRMGPELRFRPGALAAFVQGVRQQ